MKRLGFLVFLLSIAHVATAQAVTVFDFKGVGDKFGISDTNVDYIGGSKSFDLLFRNSFVTDLTIATYSVCLSCENSFFTRTGDSIRRLSPGQEVPVTITFFANLGRFDRVPSFFIDFHAVPVPPAILLMSSGCMIAAAGAWLRRRKSYSS